MKYRILIIFSLLGILLSSCSAGEELEGGLPTVETLSVEVATSSTAVLRGSTTGGTANMLCRGVCFSTMEIFSFEDSPCVSVDAGEGMFEVRTYELNPMTEYNMKAFAVMKDGTVVYGKEMTFSTTDFMLPTVAIGEVTDIYPTEVTLNATLIEPGDYPVTTKGFVYTADAASTLEIGADGAVSVLGTSSGADFSVTIGELGIGQTYRVKAYAMTENGPGYSDEITFTTLNIRPVEFAQIEEVENTYSSLKIRTSITDPQGSTISSFGFCWSSDNKLPTIKNSNYKETGADFTMSFEDVRPGKVYYVRPYAISVETGTNYGSVVRLRVATYDCDGGMVKVVPKNPVYIGWIGDYEQPDMPFKYKQAHDGVFLVNQSVGRKSPPVPSEATVQPFCIAKYEVTNRWFCEFLNVYGSRIVKDGTWQGKDMLFDQYTDISHDGTKWTVDEQYLDYPAVGVTFFGAVAFCEFFGGFLPNEAQWEVAARGNVYSDDPAVPMYRYSGSDDLSEVAVWSGDQYGSKTRCFAVGTRKANQLGLYDMSGNAQEMTSSWWGNYSSPYKENAMNANKQIVLRGGRAQRGGEANMNIFQCNARDAYGIEAAVNYSNYIGFRFACDPTDE